MHCIEPLTTFSQLTYITFWFCTLFQFSYLCLRSKPSRRLKVGHQAGRPSSSLERTSLTVFRLLSTVFLFSLSPFIFFRLFSEQSPSGVSWSQIMQSAYKPHRDISLVRFVKIQINFLHHFFSPQELLKSALRTNRDSSARAHLDALSMSVSFFLIIFFTICHLPPEKDLNRFLLCCNKRWDLIARKFFFFPTNPDRSDSSPRIQKVVEKNSGTANTLFGQGSIMSAGQHSDRQPFRTFNDFLTRPVFRTFLLQSCSHWPLILWLALIWRKIQQLAGFLVIFFKEKSIQP